MCRHAFIDNDPKWPKVRDYDHITRYFLSTAHRQCNLKRPIGFRIPVFFHNLWWYDAHVIVHEFGIRPDRVIKVIGQNMEKYQGYRRNQGYRPKYGKVSSGEVRKNMVFRDSLQLLTAFLEQLTASLAKTGRRNFYNLHEVVSQITPGWTLNWSSERPYSAMTTLTQSRGSMNPLYFHHRFSSTKSEAQSARRPTTRRPNTCSQTFSVKTSRII